MAADGTSRTDADADDVHTMAFVGDREHLGDDAGEVRVVRLRSDIPLDEHGGSIDQRTGRRDQRGFEAFGRDVDREHDVGLVRRLRRSLVLHLVSGSIDMARTDGSARSTIVAELPLR